MIGRIVEIAEDGRRLSCQRGFMLVHSSEGAREELGRVPLDDIAAVIASAHGISYTNNLLVALAERGAPFVLCAANHNAVGMLLALDGHHLQAQRMEAQIAARAPVHKRCWQQIVKAKLAQQAAVLRAAGAPSAPLEALIAKVKSGDSGNVEGQGARRYWGLLFGAAFRRERAAGGANAMLNYGYTVLRAATARAIVAAGLHPSIGLHHSNDANAMRLADDLIEPFRPIVDLRVWQLRQAGEAEVAPAVKRALVQCLYADMHTSAGATPVMVCMQKLAVSLAQVYLGERSALDLPLPGLPLDMAGQAATQ